VPVGREGGSAGAAFAVGATPQERACGWAHPQDRFPVAVLVAQFGQGPEQVRGGDAAVGGQPVQRCGVRAWGGLEQWLASGREAGGGARTLLASGYLVRLLPSTHGAVVHPVEVSVERGAGDAGLGCDLGHGEVVDVAEVSCPFQVPLCV